MSDKCERIKYPRAKLQTQMVDVPDEVIIDPLRLVNITNASMGEEMIEPEALLCPRHSGKFRNHGFYLHGKYDWIIVTDQHLGIVLVPLKKTDC